LAQVVTVENWRMKKVAGVKGCPEVARDFDEAGWEDANVRAETGPLEAEESAVFRGHVSVTDADLASTNAVLHFGMIDDEGWIYVNGESVGESHDWRSEPAINIRKFLFAGQNTIAVVVKNHDGRGGLNKGAALEFEKKPGPADWQRSAFNGLAEVIVQADQQAGEIKLSAAADGLDSSEMIIYAEPHLARPAVP
jgi:hypothetical protein